MGTCGRKHLLTENLQNKILTENEWVSYSYLVFFYHQPWVTTGVQRDKQVLVNRQRSHSVGQEASQCLRLLVVSGCEQEDVPYRGGTSSWNFCRSTWKASWAAVPHASLKRSPNYMENVTGAVWFILYFLGGSAESLHYIHYQIKIHLLLFPLYCTYFRIFTSFLLLHFAGGLWQC